MKLSIFYIPPGFFICNPIYVSPSKPWNSSQSRQCTMCFPFSFFILCHFVYFMLLKKRQENIQKNTRVNANMQLCLFIPIGMI